MKKILPTLFLACALTTSVASAHGSNTIFKEETIGDKYVEFEYQQEGPVVAGSPYDFVFHLDSKDTEAQIPTDSMFVRFEDSTGAIVMGASLQSSTSFNGRLTGALPAGGTYTVVAQYFKDGNKVLEASAPLTVVAPDATEQQEIAAGVNGGGSWYWWAIVFVGGVIIGLMLGRARKVS